MPRQPTALSLEIAEGSPSDRPILLAPDCCIAWSAMLKTSRQAGVQLLLISGFRSVERQRQIVMSKLTLGIPLGDLLRVNAYPGHSEHHTGRALDIASPGAAPLTEAFEDTLEYVWLSAHAGTFGFALSYPRQNTSGVDFEPWHWCLRTL